MALGALCVPFAVFAIRLHIGSLSQRAQRTAGCLALFAFPSRSLRYSSTLTCIAKGAEIFAKGAKDWWVLGALCVPFAVFAILLKYYLYRKGCDFRKGRKGLCGDSYLQHRYIAPAHHDSIQTFLFHSAALLRHAIAFCPKQFTGKIAPEL